VVVMTIAVAMASLFAVSYTLALGRPLPHHVPAAVIGNPGRHRALIGALEAVTDHGLDLYRFGSVNAAKRAIATQRIYAVLVLLRPTSRLLIASAAGTSLARVLEQAATKLPPRVGGPLRVLDLHPLPRTDPLGLDSFYIALAATILGFVTMFQLRANAPGLSFRAWLGCIVALAAVGGLVLAVVVDPVLAALHGPFPELWAALAAEIAAAALFNSTMLAFIGRWAIVPTWGLFVAIGNASSGGPVAPPLLPGFYRFVGEYLPNGATVETIRNAVYFTHDQHSGPMIVEVTWIVCALTALLLGHRLRGLTPASP
jgi:hypothetical protein